MDLGISGKTALVTGSGGGIGAAIGACLIAEGVKVVFADINQEAAKQQANSIGTADNAMALAIDVANKNAVNAAITTITEAWGGVDILVNNAGFTRDMSIRKMEEDDWDSVVDVILKGAYLCTRAALPSMVENNWGRIINISSRAYLGNPGQANYSAAKAGILGFTRAMSLEQGKRGITCNAVAPGIIDTAAVRGLRHFESVKENAEKSLPIPRLGDVKDVANAVTFLASENASYITGDVIHVTGGRY